MDDQETIASSLTSDDSPTGHNETTSDNNQRQNIDGSSHAKSPPQPAAAAAASDPPAPSKSNGQKEGKERGLRSGRSNHSKNGLDKSGHSTGRQGKQPSRKPSLRIGPKLSWKSDPRASFSDWRIEIYAENSAEPDVYHVHRNIVGFGARKSDFLAKEFLQRQTSINYDSDTNTTQLQLPESQAAVFPTVLDFMYYTQELKQSLSAEKACAVFKVSETLDVQALQNTIVEFYRKNVTLKNMGEFVTHAEKAKADRLMLVAKAKIGSLITEKPELAGLLPPKFLFDVLRIGREQLIALRNKDPKRYPEEMELSQSRHWSKAAYICASHNEKILTPKLFEQVFSEELLPSIDSSVALRIMALDSKLRNGGSEYTSLQRRCVSGITDDWEQFQKGFDSPEAVSNALRELPSHVLADILVRSMNK